MTTFEPPFNIMPYGAIEKHVTINGEPAIRAGGLVGLGGPHVYEGYVIFASSPQTSVYIRTRTEATLTAILNSIHLT